MIRRWRSMAPLLVLVMLAGCGSMPSSGGGSQPSGSPRVRCLSDPSRDDRSTSRPMVFLFCVEGP